MKLNSRKNLIPVPALLLVSLCMINLFKRLVQQSRQKIFVCNIYICSSLQDINYNEHLTANSRYSGRLIAMVSGKSEKIERVIHP